MKPSFIIFKHYKIKDEEKRSQEEKHFSSIGTKMRITYPQTTHIRREQSRIFTG
jgi:hypothetical protein